MEFTPCANMSPVSTFCDLAVSRSSLSLLGGISHFRFLSTDTQCGSGNINRPLRSASISVTVKTGVGSRIQNARGSEKCREGGRPSSPTSFCQEFSARGALTHLCSPHSTWYRALRSANEGQTDTHMSSPLFFIVLYVSLLFDVGICVMSVCPLGWKL